MMQNIVVTSPFLDENNQLFYEASYNKENKKLSLKIFNYQGVLKNKRTIQLTENIADLFTAEEYLIGLNDNHHQIYIFDVRKHLKTMATGQLNVKSGMTEKMRKNDQKFTSFFYNREQPLIYGLFDEKHVFYIRLKSFSRGDESNLSNSRNTSESLSQFNNQCEINRIYTTTEPISKLQVQYKKRIIQMPKSPKKKSVILQLSNEDKQQRLEQSRKRKDDKNHVRQQTVTYVYLLMKHKRQMRTLSVIWNNGSKPEVDEVNRDHVYDFCYRNGWDLVLNCHKNHPKGYHQIDDAESVELVLKGGYQRTITLSKKHQIFSSQQNIFIIDPDQKKIAGIYNKEYFQFSQCQTMPRTISLETTLLMLERPDFQHLKFIFYVFNFDFSQFKSYPLIVQIYKFQNLAHDQMYLNKNIQKLFTPNGLIHPHFQQKVDAYIKAFQTKSQSDSPASEKSEQEKEMRMRRQSVEKGSEILDERNPSIQAKKFLQIFVFKDSNLLYRLIYHLCNYGANVMFGEKIFAYSMSKQRKTQTNSDKDSMIEPNEQSLRKESQEMTIVEEQLKKKYRCNFDTWNQYFEEIIFKNVQALLNLCETSDKASTIYNPSMIYEQQQIDRIFCSINHVKEQLVFLSNVYKRFAGLIETSQGYQNHRNNRTLRYYHNVVDKNLNKIHSLFLVYNLFKAGTHQHCKEEPQQSERRLRKAVKVLFEKFERKRSQSIRSQKRWNRQFEFQGKSMMSMVDFSIAHLMPHEFFNSARQLISADQKLLFGVVLNSLLSNLEQFQQTAYFYWLIRNELNELIFNEERQRHEDKFMRGNQISVISGSSNKGSTNLCQEQDLALAYMGSGLIELLEGIEYVEGFRDELVFAGSENNHKITIIKRLQKLCLQMGAESYKFYIIQMCSELKLPNQIIELVDSMQIQPLIVWDQFNSYGQQQTHWQSHLKISRSFGQQQTFIIKSLINCASNSIDYLNSATYRQILFYQAKRILLIDNFIINQTNYQMDYLNYFKNYLIAQQQSNEIPDNQNKKESKEPKKIKKAQVLLRHYLLAYFIEASLFYSDRQCVRQLEELKRQCLASAQDKSFFQSVIDQCLSNQPIKQN